MSATNTAIEKVLLNGDLASLQPPERLSYYKQVCESVGLNPTTQPFSYITLNGKLVLYATRACSEQLRKIHNVSVKISSRTQHNDLYIVTAQAKMPDGREDESIGAVSTIGLKGDALANSLMKAETKAKRRVTLSICGLGLLDETEIETIPVRGPALKVSESQMARLHEAGNPPHPPKFNEDEPIPFADFKEDTKL